MSAYDIPDFVSFRYLLGTLQISSVHMADISSLDPQGSNQSQPHILVEEKIFSPDQHVVENFSEDILGNGRPHLGPKGLLTPLNMWTSTNLPKIFWVAIAPKPLEVTSPQARWTSYGRTTMSQLNPSAAIHDQGWLIADVARTDQ